MATMELVVELPVGEAEEAAEGVVVAVVGEAVESVALEL